MPQFDTFFITVLEQIDMHVFGGTGELVAPPTTCDLLSVASTGLVCSLYSVGRSLLAVAILWPLGYGAFVSLDKVLCIT